MHEPGDDSQEYLQDNAPSGNEEDNRAIPSLLSSKPTRRAHSVSTPRCQVSNQGTSFAAHNWPPLVPLLTTANSCFRVLPHLENNLEAKVQAEHCVNLYHSARFTIFTFLRSSRSHQPSRHRRRRVPYPVCPRRSCGLRQRRRVLDRRGTAS